MEAAKLRADIPSKFYGQKPLSDTNPHHSSRLGTVTKLNRLAPAVVNLEYVFVD
ncbi:hypothetical protein SK128_000646 [Halocaridina rubra]|uniref:Uncharacterized protein n=1 Tax=Halocaridina rubra TaxID=373956 RepID=A0AAN8ZZN4_HALRR